MHSHSGCCGCYVTTGMARRSFFSAIGGGALGAAALSTLVSADELAAVPSIGKRLSMTRERKTLSVQPVFSYSLFERRDATSWRPWGGFHSEADIAGEINRIQGELDALRQQAEFPLEVLPVARCSNMADAKEIANISADVVLVFGAIGNGEEIEALFKEKPDSYKLIFVRHKSGPVYLWYETVHCRMLRKTDDVYGEPGLEPEDIIVDDYGDVLWRLRSLYALKNTLGSTVVCISGPSGWGRGGEKSPERARKLFKMNLVDISLDDFGKRIASARNEPARLQRAVADAEEWLKLPGTSLETDRGFVDRAFLVASVFEEIMAEHKTQNITVNNCMGAIMPLCETTACLSLTLINDAGALAFCESDFAVIPSGILLHHIAGTPVFLQDPTYPHHGIITLAHCTAPRKMDGQNYEETRVVTHYESDYGAAPKVNMRLGQTVTVIDPDFENKQWIGFRGKIEANPFLDICRSQVDVSIEGDHAQLARDMRGFHWMLAYGDHLKEYGYAIHKLGIGWLNLTTQRTLEA